LYVFAFFYFFLFYLCYAPNIALYLTHAFLATKFTPVVAT